MTTRTKSIPFALGNTQQTDHKVGKCWTYIASAFLDETTDINSTATNDVPLGGTADDYIAFGCERTFDSISFDTQTTPAGGSQAIEYWNGAWVTLTTSGTVTQADNTTFYWDTPTDWATTTLNSEGDGPWYYIRIRVATNRTTAGALHAVNLGVQMKWANARSITIPETGVTIRNAFVHLVWDSSATTGIENKNVRVRFNAASFTAGVTRWTTTNAWTHGEAWKHTCTFDVTALLSTAYGAGATFTVDGDLSWVYRGIGSTYQSHCHAILWVTYDYDDTSTTQLNFAALPVDSLTGAIGTSQATIGGTGGIRQLTGAGGIIQENSPSIVDLWMHYAGNAGEAGTTDYDVYGQIDSEAETLLANYDAANQSDYNREIIWRRTDLTTSAAHDLKARVTSATGATWSNVGATVWVVWSFTESGTTVRTGQMMLPTQISLGLAEGTAATARDVYNQDFWIEGANAALLHGGSVVHWTQIADPGNLLYAFGGQTARSYSCSASNTSTTLTLSQRFDSGAQAGSGVTFARGNVTLQHNVYADTTPANVGSISAMTYVTFAYDATAGKRHSFAIFPLFYATTFAVGTVRLTGSVQFLIPEASHWIAGCGYEMTENAAIVGSTRGVRAALGNNLGWVDTCKGVLFPDANDGARVCHFNGNDCIKKSPTFLGTKFDPVSASRVIHSDGTISRLTSCMAFVNWHDYTYQSTLTIAGSAGGTVSVEVRDKATSEALIQTSRTGDGTVAVTWYDSARDVVATALESTTRAGQSLAFVFGSNLTLPVVAGISTDPGEATVKTGTAYTFDGAAKTGSYTGSDRWTDPGEDNVRSATAYKANSLTNNKTGSCAVPAAGNVLAGVAVDATTGTFDESARNTDPGVANVADGVTYKIQNVSKTGTYDPGGAVYTDPGVANVKDGVSYTFNDLPKVGTYDPIVDPADVTAATQTLVTFPPTTFPPASDPPTASDYVRAVLSAAMP